MMEVKPDEGAKEREAIKGIVLQLQNAIDEQGREFEKLFFELMDCIYIVQQVESTSSSQAQQLNQKLKQQDDQKSAQIKTLQDKLNSMQKQVQQQIQQTQSQQSQQSKSKQGSSVRKVVVSNEAPPNVQPEKTSDVRRLEEEVKLLKLELMNRDARAEPMQYTQLMKKLLKSLHLAKVVTEAAQKKEE